MRDTIAEAARAVPATGLLFYRLVRDERIDRRKRAAVVAALAYAVLPFDFIPDRLPFVGRVDDIVVGAAALQALCDAAGDDIVNEHWTGSPRALDAVLSGVDVVAGIMPKPLKRLLRGAR